MTIVNDNSRVVNKLDASLTDDDRVVIYDRHMFVVPATDPMWLWYKIAPMTKTTAYVTVRKELLSGLNQVHYWRSFCETFKHYNLLARPACLASPPARTRLPALLVTATRALALLKRIFAKWYALSNLLLLDVCRKRLYF